MFLRFYQTCMLVGDAITILSAGKTGYDRLRDAVDNRRDIEAFDAYQQRFIEVLEQALAVELTENVGREDLLQLYTDRRQDILEKLEGVNVGDQEETVNRLCDSITDVLLEELADYDIEKDQLRRAAEQAYRETLKEIIQETDDEDQRILLEMAQDIQIDVDELRTTLNEIKTYFDDRPELVGRQEKYRLLYPQTDDDWADELAVGLDVQREQREFPFLEPDAFDRITDTDAKRVLLAGRKGAGKSRTLAEGVASLAKSIEFSRVVIVQKEMARTEDLVKAFQDVGGDTLLVFDDLQKSVKTDGLNFEDALTELEQRLEQNDNDLYVRATTRSEDFEDVVPDGWSLDNLTGRRDTGAKHEQWTAFDGVRLPTLDGKRLKQFVEQSLTFHDLDPDDETRTAFIEAVMERDPTPFYIMSVCRNAGRRLGHGDIERLPQDAVEEWQRAYSSLEDDETLVRLLETLVILDTVGVTPRKEVVKRLHGHFSDGRAAEAISRLEMLGWVVEQSSRRETQIVIHDVQLEAIDFELNDLEGDGLLDFSDFLLDNRRVERLPDDLSAHLNASFAEYVYKQPLGSRPAEDARRHFERAVDLVSESPTVHVSYARFLEQRVVAPTNEIIQQYEAARKKDPADARISRQFCRFLERRNEADLAIDVYEKAIEHNPRDTAIRSNFAELLAKQDDVDRAIDVYEKGLEQIPGDTYLCYQFAWLLQRQGMVDRAIDVYEKELEQIPDDTWLRGRFATLLERQDEVDRAIDVYEEGLEQVPGDTSLRRGFAKLLAEQDEFDRAIDVYEEGIKQAPGDRDLCSGFAKLLAEQDEFDRAIDVYEEGLKQVPGDTLLRRDFARLLAEQDEFDRAIDVYEEGFKQVPADRYLCLDFAGLLEEQEEFDRAIDVYEEGLKQAPGDRELCSGIADLLAAQDEVDRAIDIYEEGIEYTPEPQMRYYFAEFLAEQDEVDRAIDVYEKGLEQNPGNTRLRQYFAEFLAEQDEVDLAIDVYEKGLEQNPGDTRFRLGFAEFLAELDEVDRAIDVYEKGLEQNPGDTQLRCGFAELLTTEGNIGDATEVFSKLITAEDEALRKKFADFLEERGLSEQATQVLENGDTQ